MSIDSIVNEYGKHGSSGPGTSPPQLSTSRHQLNGSGKQGTYAIEVEQAAQSISGSSNSGVPEIGTLFEGRVIAGWCTGSYIKLNHYGVVVLVKPDQPEPGQPKPRLVDNVFPSLAEEYSGYEVVATSYEITWVPHSYGIWRQIIGKVLPEEVNRVLELEKSKTIMPNDKSKKSDHGTLINF